MTPICHFWVCRLVSYVLSCLLPSLRKGSYPGNGLASHTSSTPVVCSPFARLGDRLPQDSWHSFIEAWLLGARPVTRGLPESHVHRFLTSQNQLDLYVGAFYPVDERLAYPLLTWSSVSAI
jgi:hypothetical protein